MANQLFLHPHISEFFSKVALNRVIGVDQIRLWYEWQHDHTEFSGQAEVEVWILS